MTLLLLLSHFSRVRLCVTPETAAHQAPPSLGFSRQEHSSGLLLPSPMHESEKWKWSCSVVSDPQRPHGLQPSRLLCPWDFPGKSTGVGCHYLRLSYCIHISVNLLKNKTDPSRINPAYAWLPTVVFKLSVEGSLGSLGFLGLEVEVKVEGYMSVKHTLQLCLEMSCLLSCMFSFLACPLSWTRRLHKIREFAVSISVSLVSAREMLVQLRFWK